MIGRRAVIGLSLFCALACSASAVSSAMAETKTTTAFTCEKKAIEGGAGFSKEHCREADAVSTGAKFEHVPIVPGSGTTFDATNEKTSSETTASTNAVLSTTVTGLKAVITCKKVTATGELENFEAAGAMDIKQRKVVIHLTECVATGAFPNILGCQPENKTVISNELSSTSLVNTMETEYAGPGGVFGAIRWTGCLEKFHNENPLEITGTFKAIGDGATLETTAASTAGLRAGGQVLSFTSRLTSRMISGTTLENPIGATTIVDP